uniref:Uncharacterized protein n=1 Tax=Arundo donax TaxID=35708 RepID=A0A0A9H0R8_ARUDO
MDSIGSMPHLGCQ